MNGAVKGFTSTIVTGFIGLAILAWFLQYAGNTEKIAKGFSGSFGRLSKAAQGS